MVLSMRERREVRIDVSICANWGNLLADVARSADFDAVFPSASVISTSLPLLPLRRLLSGLGDLG